MEYTTRFVRQYAAEVEPQYGWKYPIAMMWPSGVIPQNRVPFSYVPSATTPPSWNVGLLSNQCVEQPRTCSGGLPSTQSPCWTRTWSIMWKVCVFCHPVALHVMNAPFARSPFALFGVQVGLKFVSPETSTNLSCPACGHSTEWMNR